MREFRESPLSDAAISKWEECMQRVRARLEVGKREYGDSSFERPLLSIAEEIRQEIEDQIGWSFIAWSRLSELESRIVRLHSDVDRAERPASDEFLVEPGSRK